MGILKHSLFVLVLILVGCSTTTKTHFESFPIADSEFKLEPEELRNKYSDIDKYDGYFSHGFLALVDKLPPMLELQKAWGEPKTKRLSWWNLPYAGTYGGILAAVSAPAAVIIAGPPLLVSIQPVGFWEWEKGDYSISCRVDYPAALKYKPHLMYWRWIYRKHTDNEPNQEGQKFGEAQK